MKGVDICEQLTSARVLLLKFGCTNVLMARASGDPAGVYL